MSGHGRTLNMALIAILAIACAVFAWSGWQLISRQREYSDARAEYDALRDAFNQSNQSSGEQPDAQGVDFDGLRALNPDVVGWVDMPGTDISYPIVQTGDNDTYLHTGFDGQKSLSGAIFADCDCASDLMGAHTIIYGHHMRDGSMFAGLMSFRDADFFAAHERILLTTPERELSLTVIAAHAVSADAPLRRFEFCQGELEAFVEECLAGAELVREGIDLARVERLYTFITCSYEAADMRTAVHAVELA